MAFRPKPSRLAVAVCCLVVFAPAITANAAVSWKRVGTVTTLTGNQVCYTDGTNIICDSSAPTLSGGSVGIGSSSPLNALDIGTTAFGIHLNSGTPTNTAYALYNNAGTLTWNGISLGSGLSGGTTNYLPLWTTSTSQSSSILYQTGGNLGLSTITPQSSLSVNGGVAIGTTYAGTNAAGSNNLLVQGMIAIGTASPTSALTLNGVPAFQFGTNYSTVGTSQNDVPIGTSGASVRYTGAGVSTFNGIAGGVNGQILHLHNGSTNTLTLANQASADTTYANQIVTGTGGNLAISPNSAVILQYDTTATNSSGATGAWRVIGSSGGGASPAGATGQVQYNSGSGSLAASSKLTYINANNQLVVGSSAATPTTIGTGGTVAGFVMNVIPQAVAVTPVGGGGSTSTSIDWY